MFTAEFDRYFDGINSYRRFKVQLRRDLMAKVELKKASQNENTNLI